MKFCIEIEADRVSELTYLEQCARTVRQFDYQIHRSKKTQLELLKLFNEDFDTFRQFIRAAMVCATAIRPLGDCRLDAPPPG